MIRASVVSSRADYALGVWTYFAGWASLKDDRPPVFRTTISGGMTKCYNSLTREEAEDKHRQVIEKIRRKLVTPEESSRGAWVDSRCLKGLFEGLFAKFVIAGVGLTFTI